MSQLMELQTVSGRGATPPYNPSGSIAEYTVDWVDAAAALDRFTARGLPLAKNTRTGLVVRTPSIIVAARVLIPRRQLALIVSEAAITVDGLLAAGQPVPPAHPKSLYPVARSLSDGLTMFPASILKAVTAHAHAADEAGPFGHPCVPDPVTEILSTLLLDAVHDPNGEDTHADDAAALLRALAGGVGGNPDCLDAARALVDQQPAGRSETRPVTVTTARTAPPAHEPAGTVRRDPR
jgi:hypothetical protein